MATKPIKFLELHYTMTQFLIKYCIPSTFESFGRTERAHEILELDDFSLHANCVPLSRTVRPTTSCLLQTMWWSFLKNTPEMLACLKFILLFISLFPKISAGSSSCRLPITWCGLSITSRLRAVHFPVNWSRNASVSITYHCTKRVNWTTQPRNTFLVTRWNRREHFTWA